MKYNTVLLIIGVIILCAGAVLCFFPKLAAPGVIGISLGSLIIGFYSIANSKPPEQ